MLVSLLCFGWMTIHFGVASFDQKYGNNTTRVKTHTPPHFIRGKLIAFFECERVSFRLCKAERGSTSKMMFSLYTCARVSGDGRR